MLSIIAAMAHNRVIGKDNQLPWRLPADLKHFKAVTLGKPVIMGRKTFDSIGRPLPGRNNIVVTRATHYTRDGILVAHSLDEAIALAGDVPEVMLIGGAQLYAEAMPHAARMYLTLIDSDFTGDAFFPKYSADEWHEATREDYTPNEGNSHRYSFVVLERGAN